MCDRDELNRLRGYFITASDMDCVVRFSALPAEITNLQPKLRDYALVDGLRLLLEGQKIACVSLS